MTHVASRCADHAGRALSRPRKTGAAFLHYVLPTLVFFAVDAIGLWHLPGDFWGMYGNDDGIWAAWNLQGILEWSRPFDLAPFNPLSGMGSTFLPNTPWLNPAALALALPLPREIDYLISYFLYFLELSLSLILLFRVIGLSPLHAIFCSQLYLLILFPPTNGTFVTLQWYSLLPVYAHLASIANVLLVLVLRVGRYTFWVNALCVVAMLFLLICGIFSAPVTFLTYAPAYAVAGVTLLWSGKTNLREIGWKAAALSLCAVLLWLVGFKDYWEGTSLISARGALYPPAFAAGADLLSWEYWRQAWAKFDICAHPFFLCPRFPSFYLFAAALLGAVLCILDRSALRPLAIGMFLYFVFVYLFDFVSRVNLFGSLHAINAVFLIWSAFPFVSLFLGLLLIRLVRFTASPLLAWWRAFRPAWPKSAVSALAAAALPLVIPALALADWHFRIRPLQPPPPAHNPQIPLLGPSGVRHARVGPVTQYLIEHASIAPGAPFRGYTATYLVDPNGPLSRRLQQTAARVEPLSKLELYIAARSFFDRHYQNRLQETDLWEHNIPTIEEYGQWITKPAYLALDALFNPSGQSQSGRLRFNATVFLHLYELNLDLLPMLGVRYLITDLVLRDPRITLRTQQSADDAPPIYLYEIVNPNLGNWSPTQTVLARSFADAMALLRSGQVDPSRTAVVFDRLELPLVPARNATLRFVRGGFRVTAEAAATALLVLPVQYSTCWRAVASPDPPKVALQRVNGFQTLVKFSGHLDARFDFAFGLFGDAQCRSRDAAELKALGVD